MKQEVLRSAEDLARFGLISSEQKSTIDAVTARYALALPTAIAALIDTTNPNDPIARQFVPDPRELETLATESKDPIGDRKHTPVEGIVHRYRNRVLLKLVHVCPVYCRFCFRREMVGPGNEPNLTAQKLDAAYAYIATHPEISEVILTGGDPFILSEEKVASVTATLSNMSHVQTIRWHTRVPIIEPEKITHAFVSALQSDVAKTVVALHANHPREFTPQASQAIYRMTQNGITMLSQTVLLKGINDDVSTLSELMTAFLAHRITPYYLHHADLAPGTSHFRTSIQKGRELMKELRRSLSDSAMPSYILDIPGGYSKVNLESLDAEDLGDGRWRLRDDRGDWHDYVE